jgi:hypothetical protein
MVDDEPTWRERLLYVRFRVAGWFAWQLVRPFPLPLGLSPRNPIYRVSARLWGIAYTDGAVENFREFRDHILKEQG